MNVENTNSNHSFLVIHRETECALLIEKATDWWVSKGQKATCFISKEEAIKAAKQFNLTHKFYKICTINNN